LSFVKPFFVVPIGAAAGFALGAGRAGRAAPTFAVDVCMGGEAGRDGTTRS
jgi:hypothetical protein